MSSGSSKLSSDEDFSSYSKNNQHQGASQTLSHYQSQKHFQPSDSVLLGHNSSLSGSSNSRQQITQAVNKQAYKSMLYKHQNSNHQHMLSVNSSQSQDNKPKQMNKLSYLSQK